MDILEYASDIEAQGEQFYREMAAQIVIEEIQSIFGFLAKEEKYHYDPLQSMRQNESLPSLEKSSILSDSKGAFKKLTA